MHQLEKLKLSKNKLSSSDLTNISGGAKKGEHSFLFGLVTWTTSISNVMDENGYYHEQVCRESDPRK